MKAWKIEPCKCREGAGHVAGCPNRFGEIGNAIAEFIEDDKRLIAAGAVRNDSEHVAPRFKSTGPKPPGSSVGDPGGGPTGGRLAAGPRGPGPLPGVWGTGYDNSARDGSKRGAARVGFCSPKVGGTSGRRSTVVRSS